jgi:lysozyme
VRVLSHAGAAFIGRFEGYRGGLYNDPAGHCTIGFGHLVHFGPCDGHEPPSYRQGLTREEALVLLRSDAATRSAAVRHLVTVPLAQHEHDALVSFVFNVGAGAFKGSGLRARLNAGQRNLVPGQLMLWTRGGGQVLPGLRNRRRAEGRLFAHADYGA